ncbi:MAG: DUF1501 domain-containing protein, partial [Planctomycetaceae bacterium]|nr:DUF1501 domain-containing protein [Planctomycetaceae bacterium]
MRKQENTESHCVGPLDRRSWLKLGGLGVGALCSGFAPSMRVLGESRVSVVDGNGLTLPRLNDDFSVILFWANGGPSHIDMFDLKPDAPSEYRGPLRPIQTNVPGIEISEQMPLLAKSADKFTLVRSMQHQRAEHSGGTNRFLTGYSSDQANLLRSEFPDMGSVIAKHGEAEITGSPLYVANTPSYGAGAAYLGPSCEAYMPSPDMQTASGANQYTPVPIYRTTNSENDLTISRDGLANLSRRSRILNSLDRMSRDMDSTQMMDSMDLFQQRAMAMLASPKTKKAFDLSFEKKATRARYGDTHWGKSLLTCRRLVEAGARFVQCQATFRLQAKHGRTTTWDDHSVNADIFKSYGEKIPVLDCAISALIEDLSDRSMLDETLLLITSEMGRKPKIGDPRSGGVTGAGRDHWTHC